MEKAVYDFQESFACGLLKIYDSLFIGNLFPSKLFKLSADGTVMLLKINNRPRRLDFNSICEEEEEDIVYRYRQKVEANIFPFGQLVRGIKEEEYGILTSFDSPSPYKYSVDDINMLCNLFTVPEMGIVSQLWTNCKMGERYKYFTILIKFTKKINVMFETKVDFPVLVLPSHTAYA
ncbi:MAG: hypothetical protein IJ215_01020 [Clostridia bacterium]|nr:hypothetical protein [Clostridia bacterium]